MEKRSPGWKVYFVFSFFLLFLDQLTKYLIEKYLYLHEAIRIFPFFNLVSYRNVGSAFGLFKWLGNSVFIALATAAMFVLGGLIVFKKRDRLVLSILLGGAMGNVTDRIVRGYVVDFLEVHVNQYYWPAFNVADSALTVGIVLLIICQFKDYRHGSNYIR
jgi:signal peptidase II